MQRKRIRDGLRVASTVTTDGIGAIFDADGRDLVLRGDAAGIPCQIEPRRAEHRQQRQTAHAKSQPARFEHMDGLFEQHLRGKEADERADEEKQHHEDEVAACGAAGDHLHDDLADDERAADGKRVEEHGAQPTHSNHIAAALHLAPAQQEERQHREYNAHRAKHQRILPVREIRRAVSVIAQCFVIN